MKKVFSGIVFLFLILCIYSSCQKSKQLSGSTSSFIEEAKIFFSNEIAGATTNGAENPLSGVEKVPLWKYASVENYKEGKAVVVPVLFNLDNRIGTNSSGMSKLPLSKLSKLVMYKDKEDNFHTALVIYAPDSSFISGVNKFFTGMILISEWDLSLKRAYKLSNTGAKQIKIENLKATLISKQDVEVNAYIYICNSISWDVYVGGEYSYTYVQDLGCQYFDTGGGPDPIDNEEFLPPGDGGGGGGPIVELGPEADAPLGTDCESFDFRKTTTANWREAGLNKIRLKWRWVLGPNGGQMREVYINHIVYGLPIQYVNGRTLTPGESATLAAKATQAAKYYTYWNFENSPSYPSDAVVIAYFKERLHEFMTTNGGTAGATGSGSSNIVFRDEERSSIFDPYDCQ